MDDGETTLDGRILRAGLISMGINLVDHLKILAFYDEIADTLTQAQCIRVLKMRIAASCLPGDASLEQGWLEEGIKDYARLLAAAGSRPVDTSPDPGKSRRRPRPRRTRQRRGPQG